MDIQPGDRVSIVGTSAWAGLSGTVENVLRDDVVLDPAWPKGDRRAGALVMVSKASVAPLARDAALS